MQEIRAQWAEHLEYVQTTRYLRSVPRRPRQPNTLPSRLDEWAALDLRAWHHYLRVPPQAFYDIVKIIEAGSNLI